MLRTLSDLGFFSFSPLSALGALPSALGALPSGLGAFEVGAIAARTALDEGIP